ncbi:Set1C PHD Finger protein Spf1 [Schizosaccharomyces japonicus yFS275]|uniref:Set1C PHD Finger protein Spf1 n=1 Tax=Schizosaccharomyces japonicus (strain yFS275 / FY16936) TaxID=402676 RepID=B6K0D2_SCHJY|nr:Set1C PHD Finger protein Spf1 [Schizosaccharomyces japonicus yFS275]EEB06282.1 Set1C PHD Finger protein Spf1 [Schizosaccharomyces japonicus yFS275]
MSLEHHFGDGSDDNYVAKVPIKADFGEETTNASIALSQHETKDVLVKTENSTETLDKLQSSPSSSATETDEELLEHAAKQHAVDKPILTTTRRLKRPSPNQNGWNADQKPLYCVCRKPDDGRWMLGCDGCENWFHGSCVGIPETFNDLVLQYFCPSCTKNGLGVTAWRRKCRLPSCSQPSRVDIRSKYCCDAHGLEFFRQQVRKSLIDASTLKTLAMHVHDAKELRKLGTETPAYPDPVPADCVREFEKQEIAALDSRIETIDGELQYLQRKMALLKFMKEQARRLSEEHKTKNASKRDLCAYDVRLSLQDDELEVYMQSNNVDDLAAIPLEMAAESGICILEKNRCAKHSGWQAMFSDDIQCQFEVANNRKTVLQAKKLEIHERQRQRSILDVEHEGHAEFLRPQLASMDMDRLLSSTF